MRIFTSNVQSPNESILIRLEEVLAKLLHSITTSNELSQVNQMAAPGSSISRPGKKSRSGPFSSPHRLKILSQTSYLLRVIHSLVQSNRQVTQRELFYRSLSDADAPAFADQSVLNRALLSLMDTVGCDRHTLGVFTSARGLVAADPKNETICLDEFGKFLADISDHPDGLSLSESLTRMRTIQTSAKYILVVEKETLFQSFLVSETFFIHNPCILVTARGFPDNITIRFLKLLYHEELPMYYLGDLDPHGLSIYMTYMRSLPRCVWLGLRYVDVTTLDFNALVGIKMKPIDLSVLNGLVENEATPEHIKLDLNKLEERGLKYEVECLHSVDEFYLANEWLPKRIASLNLTDYLVNGVVL